MEVAISKYWPFSGKRRKDEAPVQESVDPIIPDAYESDPQKTDASMVQFQDIPAVQHEERPPAPLKLKELNECIEHSRRDIGNAMITSVIANVRNGSAVAMHSCDNKHNTLGAISTQVTSFLKAVAIIEDFQVGRYLFCEIDDHIYAVFIMMDEHVWNITIDTTKMPFGMFVNMYLDDLIEDFKRAIS